MMRPSSSAWRTKRRWTRPARGSRPRWPHRCRRPAPFPHPPPPDRQGGAWRDRVFCRACASISRRCTGSATTSSCSMCPPTTACRARAVARARRPPHRHRLRPGAGAAAAAAPRHRRVLPRLQRRRRRGRAVRQRRALYRRAAASPRSRPRRHADAGQPGGVLHARVLADGRVSVDMGVPNFDPRSLPFDAPAPARPTPSVPAAQHRDRRGVARQSARGAARRERRERTGGTHRPRHAEPVRAFRAR